MNNITNDYISKRLLRYATLLTFEKRALTLAKSCMEVSDLVQKLEIPLEEALDGADISVLYPKASKSLVNLVEKLCFEGEFNEINELEKKYPAFKLELFEIPGFGCTMAERVYDECGIQTWDDLAEAYVAQKLPSITGFGQRRLKATHEELLKRNLIVTDNHSGEIQRVVSQNPEKTPVNVWDSGCWDTSCWESEDISDLVADGSNPSLEPNAFLASSEPTCLEFALPDSTNLQNPFEDENEAGEPFDNNPKRVNFLEDSEVKTPFDDDDDDFIPVEKDAENPFGEDDDGEDVEEIFGHSSEFSKKSEQCLPYSKIDEFVLPEGVDPECPFGVCDEDVADEYPVKNSSSSGFLDNNTKNAEIHNPLCDTEFASKQAHADVLAALGRLTPNPMEALRSEFLEVSELANDSHPVLSCPVCKVALKDEENLLKCKKCRREFNKQSHTVDMRVDFSQRLGLRKELLYYSHQRCARWLERWLHPKMLDSVLISACAFHEFREGETANFLQYGALCNETTRRIALQLKARTLGKLYVATNQEDSQFEEVKNTTWVHFSYESLPFSDVSFDRILIDTLYHPERLSHELILECIRCLKPNGLILLSVPLLPAKIPQALLARFSWLKLLLPSQKSEDWLANYGLRLEKRNYCKFVQILSLRKN